MCLNAAYDLVEVDTANSGPAITAEVFRREALPLYYFLVLESTLILALGARVSSNEQDVA